MSPARSPSGGGAPTRILPPAAFGGLALLLAGAVQAAPDRAAGETEQAIAEEEPMALTDGLVLETLDGKAFDLGSLRGERTLIVTWASW